MATLDRLVAVRALQAVGGKLPGRQMASRRMYATPSFTEWATNKLPQISATHWGGLIPAMDQTIGLIRDYRSGEKLKFTEQLNFLDPASSGVWELKTGDIRLFGWFYELDCYIVSIGADANFIKRKPRQRYAACIAIVIDDRENLNLDPPKYIDSTDLRNVIST